jgi:hypothetical protein
MRCSLAAVLVVYCLFTTGFQAYFPPADPPFKTLSECTAQAKLEVKASDAAAKATLEAMQKAHPGEKVGIASDSEEWGPGGIGWECYPSDGSPSTFGGNWEDPEKRWFNMPGMTLELVKKTRQARCNDYWKAFKAKPASAKTPD